MSWEAASFLLLGVALAVGFAWYERSRPTSRVLALVAALAALAVVGRLAFAAFPNVKPTTDIVLFAGYALGGAPGFAVGSITALVSNVFLSHGPWTPWQMAAWGGVGLAGGAVGALVRRRASGRELGRWSLALVCGLAGLGFGLVMDLYLWTMSGTHTLASLVVLSGRSLPFNLAHAAGNVAFALAIGPPLVRALRRYRRRFEVRWETQPPAARSLGRGTAGSASVVGLAVLVALAGGALLAPAPARADATAAARYLLRAQNCDGGFGTSPRRSSDAQTTGWAALGLAAAGYNPQDVRRGGRSIVDYVRRNSGAIRDVGAVERTILLLDAGGLPTRRFAGRNLAAELRRAADSDPPFAGYVNHVAFGIVALRVVGEPDGSPRMERLRDWLVAAQRADGGFALSRGGGSQPEYTAMVLQALAPARADAEVDETMDEAVAYLGRAQDRASGAFGRSAGVELNAQSTAWAVQGLIAAGEGTGSGTVAGRALEYLRSRQAGDGHIRYAAGQDQTPVWVTGDSLTALSLKSFPLAAAPRRQLSSRACPGPPRAAPAARNTAGRADSEANGNRTSKRRPTGHRDRKATGDGPAGGGSGDGSGPGARASGGGPVANGGAGAGSSAELADAPADPAPAPPSVDAVPALQPNPARDRPEGDGPPGPAAGVAGAWRAFSDAGPMPLARMAAQDALRAGGDGQGRRSGSVAALALVGAAALSLLAAIAAAAWLRRLWFAPGLRRVWDGLRRRPTA